jgi:hypothetical protein
MLNIKFKTFRSTNLILVMIQFSRCVSFAYEAGRLTQPLITVIILPQRHLKKEIFL